MKIGNVNLDRLTNNTGNTREYSDGSVEDDILNLVKSKSFARKRDEILANNPSWPLYYHFTPLRGNIVSWNTFKSNSKILEIGAGCGAVTEALLAMVDSSVKIDALELSEKRALINAHRNRGAGNLRVVVGNLEEFNESGYDYVVCVGVLEYAGRFISGQEPFLKFLEKLREFIKPGGELLLAIENKLGVKYINGAREDHVGRFYESLMGYPQYDGIRTFSRKEILALFDNAGFKSTKLLFPVPDYKMPRMVVSEEYLEIAGDLSFLSRVAPAPALDQTRVYSASEQLFTDTVIEAGLYADMANSFLVKAVR